MKDFFGNPEQLQELAAYMASQINVPTIGIGGGYAPIGSINFFDATTAPQDWLACDGTVYNIADYPQLADYYESQHGSKNFYGGDGTTTFAVPDLQGEFLRGTGTNSHTNQGNGAAVGEHQDATENPILYSNYNNSAHEIYFLGNLTSSGQIRYKNQDSNIPISGNSRAWVETYTDVKGTDANEPAAITSRPTNTSFLICVKAVVAGEVYSTEERVVGTWIDGKPLYQKTVTGALSPTINTWVEGVALGTDCIIQYVMGAVAINDNFEELIPYPGDAVYIINAINGSTRKYGSVGVRAEHSSWVNKSFRMTLRYTKTTD